MLPLQVSNIDQQSCDVLISASLETHVDVIGVASGAGDKWPYILWHACWECSRIGWISAQMLTTNWGKKGQ